MPKRRIDPRVEIGAVRLRAGDLDRLLAFYVDILGFHITYRAGQTVAVLSGGGPVPQIVLAADASVHPAAPASRHFAIRYPDRHALAEAFLAIAESGVAVENARDEGIREVLYLRDPEGNQVELYWDRPREQWPMDEQGMLRPESKPLELDSLRAAATEQVAPPLPGPSPSDSPLSAETRARLGDVRLRLLNLHKVLLEDAKRGYEMDRGRVGSSANLLHLVINDPWFAWLHPLSELVVRIDETLQPDAPATEADGAVLLQQVERLLSPTGASEDFAERYFDALQRQPAVIVAHAEVRRILRQPR